MALISMFTPVVGEPREFWPSGWTLDTGAYALVPGRRPTSWAVKKTGSSQVYLKYTFSPSVLKPTIGFCLKRSSSGVITAPILTIQAQGSVGSGSVDLELIGGFLSVRGVASPIPFSLNTYTYVEMSAFFDTLNGYFIVRQDGVEVIRISGDTWLPSGNGGPVTAFLFRMGGSGNSTDVDALEDLYVTSKDGPTPYDSFLGDVVIDRLTPTSFGNVQTFTGVGGGPALVSNVSPALPDIARYNESDIVGAQDWFNFSPVPPGSANVLAVRTSAWGSKVDPGAAMMRVRQDAPGSHEVGLSTGLGVGLTRVTPLLRTADPEGNPWTLNAVNTLQSGVEVV